MVSSTINSLEVIAGLLKHVIKISGIKSHSRISCLWPKLKQEEERIRMNGSNLSSSKFQMTVKIGLGPRKNRRSIQLTQIVTQ
jgi:hypothetical protein